jgi:hypothetical protein
MVNRVRYYGKSVSRVGDCDLIADRDQKKSDRDPTFPDRDPKRIAIGGRIENQIETISNPYSWSLFLETIFFPGRYLALV